MRQEQRRLRKKETELRTRETEAVEAMDQILEAVENGEAQVANGKLRLPKWSGFLRRRAEPAGEGAPPSPVMQLVRRFLRLVVRAQSSPGGNRPTMDSRRNDDGPGW